VSGATSATMVVIVAVSACNMLGFAAVFALLPKLQKAHDLPAMGMPDHATVKALGLNPDDIFRQGPVKD